MQPATKAKRTSTKPKWHRPAQGLSTPASVPIIMMGPTETRAAGREPTGGQRITSPTPLASALRSPPSVVGRAQQQAAMHGQSYPPPSSLGAALREATPTTPGSSTSLDGRLLGSTPPAAAARGAQRSHSQSPPPQNRVPVGGGSGGRTGGTARGRRVHASVASPPSPPSSAQPSLLALSSDSVLYREEEEAAAMLKAQQLFEDVTARRVYASAEQRESLPVSFYHRGVLEMGHIANAKYRRELEQLSGGGGGGGGGAEGSAEGSGGGGAGGGRGGSAYGESPLAHHPLQVVRLNPPDEDALGRPSSQPSRLPWERPGTAVTESSYVSDLEHLLLPEGAAVRARAMRRVSSAGDIDALTLPRAATASTASSRARTHARAAVRNKRRRGRARSNPR